MKRRCLIDGLIIGLFFLLFSSCTFAAAPAITWLEVIPITATITTNKSITFKVQGYDGANNKVTYQASLMPPINWGIRSGSGTVSPVTGINTTFMAGKSPGSVTIQVSMGTVTTAALITVVDKTYPVATITQPTANAVVSGAVTISGTVVDDNLKGWVLEADVKGWKVIATGTTSAVSGVWNAAWLPGGTYSLRLIGEDTSGNKRTVYVKVFVLPPVITRLEIAPVFATVTTNSKAGFKVQGYDRANNKVIYQASLMPPINWGIRSGSGTVSPVTGINTTFMAGKSPGSVTIQVSMGTVTAAAIITVVDRTYPVATITQPAANAVVSGAVTVNGMVTDDNLKGWVLEAYVKGWKMVASGTTSAVSSVWNATGLTVGTYTLRLTGEDTSGNKKNVSINVKVVAAPVGPANIIVNPASVVIPIKGTITFAAQAYDATGKVVAGTWTPVWSVLPELGTCTPVIGISAIFVAGSMPGTTTITARYGTLSAVARVVIIDNIPPRASISYPGSGSTVFATVTVTGEVIDDNLKKWVLEAGMGQIPAAWITIGSETMDTVSCVWDTAGYDAGTYTLRLTGEDTSGNKNSVTVVVVISSYMPGGLIGKYYPNSSFTSLRFSRLDKGIDFDWSDKNFPDERMPVDAFSAIWEGWVMILQKDTYTFYTISDDGSRLWIDDKRVVDNWGLHGAMERSGSLELEPGFHKIRIEYYDDHGGACMKILWSSSSMPKAIIPAGYLYYLSYKPRIDSLTISPSSVIIESNQTQEFVVKGIDEFGQGISNDKGLIDSKWTLITDTFSTLTTTSGTLTTFIAGKNSGVATLTVSCGTCTASLKIAVYKQLLEENFDSGNDNGWINGGGKWAVEGGEYTIDSTSYSWVENSKSWINIGVRDRFVMLSKIKIVKKTGDNGEWIGIIVHKNPDAQKGDWCLVLYQNKLLFVEEGVRRMACINFSYDNGDEFWFKIYVNGNQAMAKAWRVGDQEPVDWMLSDTFPSTTIGSSYIGLYAARTTVHFDNIIIHGMDSIFPVPKITAPVANTPIPVKATITGKVFNDNLKGWVFETGMGQTPATWTTIGSGTNGSVSCVWDTAGFSPGMYTLRLIGEDMSGNKGSTSIPVIVPIRTNLPCLPGGLTGKYYAASNFTLPKFVRMDKKIDFDWGDQKFPDDRMPVDAFSVIWEGWIMILATDTYTFYTAADDGSMLWIDDRVADGEWYQTGASWPNERGGRVYLEPGFHKIRVIYFDNGSGACMKLLWSSSSIPKAIIPTGNLYYLPYETRIDTFTVYPSSAMIKPGQTQDFGVKGIDEFGQEVDSKILTDCRWAVTGDTLPGFLSNASGISTTFVAGDSYGVGSITVAYGSLTVSARIEVCDLLYYDKFDDGNDNGWNVRSGQWQVEGGSSSTGEYSGTGSGNIISLAGNPDWTDYVVEFRVCANGGSADDVSVLFRADEDSQTCYSLRGFDNILKIKGYDWSNRETLPIRVYGAAGMSLNKWYAGRIVVAGGNFKVYRDNVLILEANDSEYRQGKIGFRLYNAHAHFDDVIVKGLDIIPPMAKITPLPSAVISGTISVAGVVADRNLAGYRLQYGAGSLPANWTVMTASAAALGTTASLTAVWDTTTVSDGTYTLLLQAWDRSGNRGTDTFVVNVDNTPPAALIAFPADNSTIPAGTVTIIGTVSDGYLAGYTLECTTGGIYTRIASGTAGIAGTLGAVSLPKGTYSLRLTVKDMADHTAVQSVRVVVTEALPTAEELLQRVAENWGRIRDMRAEITDWGTTTIAESGTTTIKIFGHLNKSYLEKKPDKQKVESPSENMGYIIDGDKMCVKIFGIWNPWTEISEVFEDSSTDDILSPEYLVANKIVVNDAKPVFEGKVYVLTITPKVISSENDRWKMVIYVDYDKGVMVRSEMYDSEDNLIDIVEYSNFMFDSFSQAWVATKCVDKTMWEGFSKVTETVYKNIRINTGVTDKEFEPVFEEGD